MSKWLYGLLCLLPVLIVGGTALGLWADQNHRQNHKERDCLRYVSTHVTADVAAWRELVCHERSRP